LEGATASMSWSKRVLIHVLFPNLLVIDLFLCLSQQFFHLKVFSLQFPQLFPQLLIGHLQTDHLSLQCLFFLSIDIQLRSLLDILQQTANGSILTAALATLAGERGH
jgi:hypothetical protein